jgi:hypothetical protein
MTLEEAEELVVRSLDIALTPAERENLNQAMLKYPILNARKDQYLAIRETLSRNEEASFTPYFASRVISGILQEANNFDHEIEVFFRRFRLAALTVFIALLSTNIFFSENLDLANILGIEGETTISDEEIFTFNFYDNINEML